MNRPRPGGNVRLAPGFWVDADGALHVSIPELLEVFGLPDTEENRTALLARVEQQMHELLPDADFQHADSCPYCGLEGSGTHRPDCRYGVAE